MRTLVSIFVIGSIAFQTAFAPKAHASLICAGLFQPIDPTPPPQLALLLGQISPKQRLKFEEKFERREKVSAEREASRLITKLLLHDRDADLNLKPLAKSATRAETVKSLLQARLDIESNRIELENMLIEIGYSEGSKTSQEWRAFRDRHQGELSVAKSFAINLASTYFFGLPLFLTGVKTIGFNISRSQRRTAWPEVEQKLRASIDKSDPEVVRKVKYEVAVDFVRRILAIAVLAILTDEFLTYLTPKWGLFKLKARGSLVVETRERLEAQALENWKDIAEAFTGIRPTNDSVETQDILARIHATSKDDLWLHLQEGGALSDPAINSSSNSTSAP